MQLEENLYQKGNFFLETFLGAELKQGIYQNNYMLRSKAAIVMPNKKRTRRGDSNGSEGPEQRLAKKRRPKNLGVSHSTLIEAMVENVHEQINLNLDGLARVSDAEEKTIKPHVKAKKVRFSLKNNVVWKPEGPMPPLSVRLPPLAIPRGSALKKGVAPGPICILAPAKRKSPSKCRLMILTEKKLKNAKRFSKGSRSRKTG